MGPKKKGGKKAANDDWDEGLGETADPIAAATQQAKEEEAAQDVVEDDGEMGGGLLATLKKNRKNKQKKGKVVEDFVDGEDPPGADGDTADNKLAEKAPVEADADDLFDDLPAKKGKGGKGAQQKKADPEPAAADDDEDDDDAGGRVKSKKEKEREKKEREKQRKKEQVRLGDCYSGCHRLANSEMYRPQRRRRQSLRRPSSSKKLRKLRPRPRLRHQQREARRKS